MTTPPPTDSDSVGLKPCPFCGSEDVADFIAINGNTYIGCANCGGRGGDFEGRSHAVEFWNARTPKASTLDADPMRELQRLGQEFDADRERIARIIDKIDVQAKCLEGYAEQDGHSGKAPASVYHWQATHFRDIATELRDAILASPNASRGGDASYWLIELRGTPPLWSTSPTAPTGLGGFKSDVMHAHRYPTKTAAQDHLRRMPKQDRDQCFVSEHMDVGMPAQPNASNGVSAWNEAIEAAALVCDVKAAKADLFDSPSARLCKEQAEVCARIVRTLTKPLTDQKAGS